MPLSVDRRWRAGALAFLAMALAAPADADPVADAKRARVEALRQMLEGDPCARRAEALALLDSGSTPPAPLPAPADGPATVPATDQAASPPTPPPAPKEQPGSRKLARPELVERLRQSVVLVISGTDSGSGFMIGPNRVLTNHHVIAQAGKNPIIVTGPGLHGPRIARLVAQERAKQEGGRDYAVLEIDGPGAPTTLRLSPLAAELQEVVAAGYPGLLLANDKNFEALAKGDLAAMPNLALSQGAVMARQNAGRGVETLAHTAAISGGNSGGPLVDACGDVVGINTFINVSVEQASRAGFALAAGDAMSFLRERKIPFEEVSTGCLP